jgi:hypothetical protein
MDILYCHQKNPTNNNVWAPNIRVNTIYQLLSVRDIYDIVKDFENILCFTNVNKRHRKLYFDNIKSITDDNVHLLHSGIIPVHCTENIHTMDLRRAWNIPKNLSCLYNLRSVVLCFEIPCDVSEYSTNIKALESVLPRLNSFSLSRVSNLDVRFFENMIINSHLNKLEIRETSFSNCLQPYYDNIYNKPPSTLKYLVLDNCMHIEDINILAPLQA